MENLAELVAVAREFADDPRGRAVRRPGRRRRRRTRPACSDFLERVALVADSDQIPDAPEEERGRAARRGHADDAAHRQGPGVPGRVPHRSRGRRLPAHAVAGRQARARGGAPARLRRADPCPRAALRLAGRRTLRVGGAAAQPGVAVRRRAPGRPRRLAPYRGRDDVVEPPQLRHAPAARGAPAASLRYGDRALGRRARRPRPAGRSRRWTPATASSTTASASARWSRSRAPAPTTPSPRSTSAPRASSGCCCATRRWRSCSRARSHRVRTGDGEAHPSTARDCPPGRPPDRSTAKGHKRMGLARWGNRLGSASAGCA